MGQQGTRCSVRRSEAEGMPKQGRRQGKALRRARGACSIEYPKDPLSRMCIWEDCPNQVSLCASP